MNIIETIQEGVINGIKSLYDGSITTENITLSGTRKEFEGDYTVVVFPFTKLAKKPPNVIAEELGTFLKNEVAHITDYNVIKGFLNLSVSDAYWTTFLDGIYKDPNFGKFAFNGNKVMVEFCSPNTNKPLHLGHIRNILLGWSISKVLEAAGNEVIKVQIVNDRGIAICKSMLAWKKFGEHTTPESEGIKSDHFVGKYYVLFEKKFQEEYKIWQQTEQGQAIFKEKKKEDQTEEVFFKAFKNSYFNEYSQLGGEAKEMLRLWEANDKQTLDLWRQMNQWVYNGFEETYDKLGVTFDKLYYESNTYLLGKDLIDAGLKENIFYEKEDGSVWIDLEEAKLGQKLVLRSDGTSVYITQDIGTAELRYEDYGTKQMVYVVGDEQNYHFQVLFETLKKLGKEYANGLYHLSYGMVDLPTGKMKSREGTVVDADDLVAEVIEEARLNSKERGMLDEVSKEEQEDILRKIGLAALKFFIIKVFPKKRMVFNPKESVDLQGQTGPYVQNAFVRIQSVLRKFGSNEFEVETSYKDLKIQERELLTKLYSYPEIIQEAASAFDPSAIANYCYELAKDYHRFYHDLSILKAESDAARVFRLKLSQAVANVLQSGMDLLGIEMPDRM